MDHSATPADEFRYQTRGFAKYSDIVRLFGWECFTAFYNQESLLANANRQPDDGLSGEDSRTLRFSIQAGEDLRPLIEFWGVFPHNADRLRARHEERGLAPGDKVRCLVSAASERGAERGAYPSPTNLAPPPTHTYQSGASLAASVAPRPPAPPLPIWIVPSLSVALR